MDNSYSKSGFLLWIFVISGFAGLIYQSIWTQYLGLILGHSAYAQVLVLALFMGGMALGAWAVSRRSELLKKPLLVYAAIELIIGIFGVGFHAAYTHIHAFSYASFFPMLSSGLPLEMGRWAVAGTLILPQCILLGATFPLMSAGYLRWRPDAGGRVLAGLYFTNSLGAAAGALASTYVLLPSIGLPGTVFTAGIMNILVAALVWPLARLQQPPHNETTKLPENTEEKAAPRFILWAAAMTGASSFVYEIVWVRMLSMALGSTLHAFELMLAAFISGIAFGGWWLRKRADRLRSSQKAAGFAQVSKGFSAISTLFIYNFSFYLVAWFLQALNLNSDSAYTLYNLASAAISIAVMFPAAFFAGMTLPLFTLTLLRKNVGEKAIGRVYAVNTLGSIIGVILTIYFLIPLLGLRLSLWGAAAVDVVLGLALLTTGAKANRAERKKLALAFASCAAVLLLSVFASKFDTSLMSSSVFRLGGIGTSHEVLYHEDGRTASVAMAQWGGSLVLSTNGKADAAIGTGEALSVDEMTMVALAVMPMLYKPEAKSVGIIGFGSGMSTHFALGNPDIGEVDTVEIEPAMVRAARLFGEKVERAYEDKRSKIIVDDAKSYFSTNRKKYDIIISEPSNPWVSGVAALFSKEFYEFIPKHLTDDGLFVQWLQLYEITPELVASVLKGLLPYFADIQFFLSEPSDLLMVASPKHKLPKIDTLAFPETWPQAFREEMALRGLRENLDISTLYFGNKEILEAFVGLFPSLPPHSDYFPILQLEAPKTRFKMSRTTFFTDIKHADWPLLEVFTGLPAPPLEYVGLPKQTRSDYLNMRKTAKELKRRLLNEPQPEEGKLELLEALLADYLKTLGKTCHFPTGGEGLLALTNMARLTIPFLKAEDLDALWINPTWLLCEPKNNTVQEYLSFLSASAKRNHLNVVLHGENLLKNEEFTSDTALAGYVLGGTQLSAFAMGNMEKVVELESQHAHNAMPNNARAILVQAARN